MHKNKLLTILLILFTNIVFAQTLERISTTFEDDWSFIEFDPPVNNIWQVGRPSKALLDSAYSGPYALMTETANMLTDSIKHSFILKFERPWHNNAITGWAIPFRQRYSFDSIFSGGYIEVSYNHGASWLTIYDKTPFKEIGKYNSGLYTPSDTLTNGTAALNGNLTWDFKERANCEAYFFCTTDGAVLVNSVWLKFTYLNLARNNPHEGWLIDDIEFNIFVSCEFITDGFEQTTISSKIKTYPNPANNLVTIEYPMAAGNGYLLTLYDYSGKLQLKQYAVCGENHQLDISPYPNGYYNYTLVDENGKQLIGKFIINR